MTTLNKNLSYRFRESVNAIQLTENTVIIGSNHRNFVELTINDEMISVALHRFAEGVTLNTISANFADDEACWINFLSIINALLAKGLIEPIEEKENDNYLRRFDRQILFFRDVMNISHDEALKIQKKIGNARVGVLGVGGVGSYIVRTLSSMGFGRINILDHDRVEESNISRQIFYDYKDIGRKKIEVVKEKVKYISPTTEIIEFDINVRTIEDIRQIAKSSDLLLCAIDSPKPFIYDIVSRIPFDYHIPTVYGGSVSDNVSVGPTVISGKSRCLKCVRGIDQSVESFSNLEFVNSIRSRYTTTLIDPINALAASIMSIEAVKVVTNFATPMFGNSFIVNLEAYTKSNYVPLGKNSACPVCNRIKKTEMN